MMKEDKVKARKGLSNYVLPATGAAWRAEPISSGSLVRPSRIATASRYWS